MGSGNAYHPPAADRSSALNTDEITVVHVDDDVAFADLVADVMETQAERLTVETETDPRQALQTLDTRTPGVDCVLSDYEMPGLTGLELLDELDGQGVDLPFILYTGKGSEAIASRAIAAGVTDYIQKETGTDHFEVVANRIEEAVAQHRAERSVFRNERNYQQLIETAPTPVTMYDRTGQYIYVNQAAVEFFGAESREALLTRSKYDFVSPAEHETLDRRLEQLAAGHEIPVSKHAYIGVDGQRRTGVVSCAPALFSADAAGVSVIRDTTAETDLAPALDDIASALAHDIQSPLDVLYSRIELAQETGDHSHLETAKDSVARVERFIDQTIDVLRHEDLTLDPEPVDLGQCCREVWARLTTDTATLEVAASPVVVADEHALTSVVENLVRNALEHGGPDATVTVGALSDGFWVADDGPGIDPEYRDSVFRPGHTTGDGAGLGLTSVQQIAHAHGWTVTCTESEAGGARFEVTGITRRE